MDGHPFNASIARTGSEGTSPFLYDAQGILVFISKWNACFRFYLYKISRSLIP